MSASERVRRNTSAKEEGRALACENTSVLDKFNTNARARER